MKDELSMSSVLYPTEEGWIALKEKVKNIELRFPSDFEDMFNHYINDVDNSYKLVYGFETVKKLFPEFLGKSKYTKKEHTFVESPMQEYLRIKGITLKQFKSQMASIAYNDYD